MIEKFNNISNKLKSKIYFNFDIGKYTWFRTGGNAKIFIIVENNIELEIILNLITDEDVFIIGSGSNLLVRDYGFNGIILKLGRGFKNIKINENKIEVGAATADVNLSRFAQKNNIKGFEFFSGIPGSLGGAVKMNAGCYGSETKKYLDCIEVFNQKGFKKILNKNELDLKYRSSNISNTDIISKILFNYEEGNPNEILKKMQNIQKQRIKSQPIKYKTSGSTFKNPNNFYAAKLIEEAGCKGLEVGGAIVRKKHANFLINQNKASASDLENLGKLIINKVKNKFDIELKWEIKIIGEEN